MASLGQKRGSYGHVMALFEHVCSVIYYQFKVTYRSKQGWVLLSYVLYNPFQHSSCHYNKLIK